MAPEPFRWTVEGLMALQEATEDFIVHVRVCCGGAGLGCGWRLRFAALC